MKQIPVYMFTGFLEGGKTRFMQETLCDKRFNDGERTLVLMCEEGIEELDPSKFPSKYVYIETIEDIEEVTSEDLTKLVKKYQADRVLIEYNGMWLLSDLARVFPKEWTVYQEFMFVDAKTFIPYNTNMRSLMVDKLMTAELVVLNRADDTLNKEEIHKIIRGVSRRANIAYEYTDGHVEYDDIEDPLPFDVDAPVIEIGDNDYAIWYRDMSEELKKYAGKTVRFKGIVARNARLPEDTFIAGRHVMTCCVDDIEYSGLVCKWDKADTLTQRQWVIVTASIEVRFNRIYGGRGPVLHVIDVEPAQKPEKEVATFY
ncbi:MAG: TIGR03943 family protein [Clostridia bacterium]|nr:TIGR03943 family protein [Clostridia bacterium]